MVNETKPGVTKLTVSIRILLSSGLVRNNDQGEGVG